MENKLNKDDLIHKTGNKKKKIKHMIFESLKHSFFARELYSNDLSLDEALEQQIKLKDYIEIFKESKKPKESVKKEKKTLNLENAIILLNGKQKVLNAFESGIVPKRKQETGLKTLTLKKMFQRLPIAFA